MTAKEMAAQITFVKGEPVCRYNNILMTDEECLKKWGICEGDFFCYDVDMYLVDDVLYTDAPLVQIIRTLATKEYGDPWKGCYTKDPDTINMLGIHLTAEQELSHMLEDSFVVRRAALEEIRAIKPFKEFKKKYKNVDVRGYMAFMDALDCYYELDSGNLDPDRDYYEQTGTVPIK